MNAFVKETEEIRSSSCFSAFIVTSVFPTSDKVMCDVPTFAQLSGVFSQESCQQNVAGGSVANVISSLNFTYWHKMVVTHQSASWM